MPIKIGILNETDEYERRVAATPQISHLLNKLDLAWVMESGAGVQAGYPDSECRNGSCNSHFEQKRKRRAVTSFRR